MIYFITKNPNHQVVTVEGEIETRSELETPDVDFILSLRVLGLDLETNDLDPYIGEILLLIVGNNEVQYVIDIHTIDCSFLYKIDKDTVFLGTNLKFDFKFIKVKFHYTMYKMFDIMIVEQRLTQGTGLSCSLASIKERRLGLASNKEIRNEFIGANPKNFIFKNKHIQYGASDIKDLFIIREKQKEWIEKRNLQLLIYGIEFPLVRVLGKAELHGMDINEAKWIALVNKNKEEKFKLECELDEELRRLRDILLPVNEKIYLSNGKFDRIRTKPSTIKIENLFGDSFDEIEINPTGKEKKKTKDKSPYINYSSSSELLYILARLHQPVPTINVINNQPGEPEIPTFRIRKGKEVIDKDHSRFTLGAGAVESYIIENPTSIAKTFLEKLVKYREYTVKINTFGEEFIRKYKNRVSKKFHTVYRQCFAITGRLQSGDKDQGYYNSQNIPADNEYRECFHYENEYIITTDLQGAEAVVMIDKARDEKFYELAIVNDDAHSPLGTAVWRAIGKRRLEKIRTSSETFLNQVLSGQHLGNTIDSSKLDDAKRLSEITISKKENKDMRTIFKNTTFASIYGCGVKKYAKMLNISIEEAKIGLDIMNSSLPKTFASRRRSEQFALANGYLILNYRTNSTIIYTKITEARKYGVTLNENELFEIRNSARNGDIQGTQADMVKEIMVEIDKEIERQDLYNKFGVALLKQVHDETVYKTKDITTLIEFSEDIREKGQIVPVEMLTIPEFLKRMHCKICNRYLSFIKMTAGQEIGKTWIK